MILDEWLDDIPQQFLHKHNIEVLISALSRQLQELADVYTTMNSKTSIDEAEGYGLDFIGDILSLSRKDAHLILRSAVDEEIDDDRYRKLLKYWAIRNNMDCTYENIMDGLSLIWNNSEVAYEEIQPAKIRLTLKQLDLDDESTNYNTVAAFRPSGVKLWYVLAFYLLIDIAEMEIFYLSRVGYRFIISELDSKLLDGTWILDGSELLNISVAGFYARMGYRFKMYTDYSTWYLNGEYKMNGERHLDAKNIDEFVWVTINGARED